MSCYYIIKSPSGDGDIKIPVKYGLIEITNDIKSKLEALKKVSDIDETEEQKNEQTEKINDLASSINLLVPSEISIRTIKNTIAKNIDNVENIVPEINKLISNTGSYDSINAAIVYYIKSKKGNLSDLFNKLNKPIKPKYFKGLSMDGVLGITNIKQERSKILGRINENLDFGFSNVIPDSLKIFMNGIVNDSNKSYKQLLESNVLLGTNNTFGGRALNIEGYTFFNVNDDLSLFLGLFKRVASDIDKESLYNIINKFNNDVKFKKYGKLEIGTLEEFDVFKFFNGELGDKGKLNLGGFDRLLDLSSNDNIKPIITNILKLVSDHLKPNDSQLFKSIKLLFSSLDPNKYGSEALQLELRQDQFLNNEIKTGQEYKNKIVADFLSKNFESNRNEFYSQKEKITSNLYEEAIKNITLNQDIIKFKSGKITPYGVVTAIYPRSNGVLIYGTYKNQFGEYEKLSQLFLEKSDSISYRKRENSKELYNSSETVIPNTDGVLVATDTSFKQSLLKKLLKKGDKIITKSGDLLVVGVHAGSILVKSKNNIVTEMQYSKIKAIFSEQAKIDIDTAKRVDIKKYVQITDPSLLSDGDLFIDPGTTFYKQILYSDNENVYSWLEQKDKDTIIKATPKENIKQGLVYTFGNLTQSELLKIKTELDNIGKSNANMSSFVDENLVKNDDYFVINNNIFGKVTNFESKKGVIFNPDTNKLEPYIYADKDAIFLTDRNISSDFWASISRVNDWKIQVFSEEDANENPALKEAKYVIPNIIDPNDLILLPSGYANIGKFRDIDASVDVDEKVVTDHIIRLMKESQNITFTKDSKLYLETEDPEGKSKKYKRNLYSLHRIGNFDKLTTEVKKELDVLQQGTYFSVYKENSLDSNIYRIMSVSNGIVTAHLNKSSKYGKMLTTERKFTVDELLASKTDSETNNKINSISALYLLYGNNKFNVVLKAINEKLNVSEVRNQKEINTTIKKMQTAFKPLKINVKQVSPSVGNFQDGQKAKIETLFDENNKPKTSILLNSESGTNTDLVHETLHIYLTLLRYTDPDLYNKFLNSVLGEDNDLDVTEKEEEFVKKVSKGIETNTDFIATNIKDFVISLASALKFLNPDIDIDITEAIDDPLTTLNLPLREVFNVSIDNSHPMYNLSMIMTEPMMRDWMSNQKIILKC